MSTQIATLPTGSDSSQWNDEERALVEAAGLVHTDTQTNVKTLADRPVVAAFLAHCARTGLDPIARQIYCIARKSRGQLKWQTQVSIDGARLVAERSGQYEGQTTPEFTGDGTTWTSVWLGPGFPKAARVGVYRRGFREALFAVALWDAYVQTKYNGEISDMWSKMGPLMLAKCAEMLALRKAFPQDLSGLYTAEEMAQAAPAAAPPAPAVASAPAAAEGVEDATVVPDEVTRAVGTVVSLREYLVAIVPEVVAIDSVAALTPLYQEAEGASVLGELVAPGVTVKALLFGRRRVLEGNAAQVDAAVLALVETTAGVEPVEAEVVDEGTPAVLDGMDER